MLITDDLFRGIPLRPAERAALAGPPSGAGAVDRQPDPAAIIEGLVPLRSAEDCDERLPRDTRIQPFGEIAQRVVSKRSADREISSCRGAHQGFDGVKTVLAQDLADQQGPEQSLGRNLRLPSAVAGGPEITLQPKTLRHVAPKALRRRCLHRRRFRPCFRARTSNWALAANTSRTAS
jgi:hypothetical protein